jgi:uncharacterized protein
MQLNVLRELRQPLGSVNEYDISEPRTDLDGIVLTEVTGTLRLLRTDRGFLARITASGRLQEPCARCLKDAEVPVSADFEEEYVPVYDPNTGTRIHIGADEDVFRIGPHFDLDLREAVRQYILMAEPVKPLCTAECLGLCPNCGADLNLGPCRCEPEPDSPWSALAGLKKEDEGSS